MPRCIQILTLVLTFLSCGRAGIEDIDFEPEPGVYRYTRYTDAQNDLLGKYLTEYENFQETQSEGDKNAMQTVKLMIVQSWIYALSPNKDLLVGFIGMKEKKSLKEIWLALRENIMAKTEAIVADDFLLYEGGISQLFRGTLEEGAEILSSKVAQIEIKIAKENNDLKKEELDHQRLARIDERNQVELLMNIHDAALRMALQSYILDFVKDPKGLKTFEIVSSDSLKKRVLKVPSLKKGSVAALFDDDLDDEENENDSKQNK